MRYQNAKICDNNHLEKSTITAPEDPSYVFSNAVDLANRNKVYKPGTKSFTIEVDTLSNSNNVSFFAIIGESNSKLKLSNSAVITLKANSINLFTGGEPFSKQVPVYDLGAYLNISDNDNEDGINYRYWQVVIDDSYNPDDVEIAYIYLGDNTIIHRNINNGFNYTNIDRTLRGVSDSGKLFTLKKAEQTLIRATSYQNMSRDDKDNLLRTIRRIGLHSPFLFVMDPDECRETLDFGVRPVYFDRSVPSFVQIVRDIYSSTYAMREVL